MITIKKISKTFYKNTANENSIFNSLDLTIQNGDFVNIVGTNGSGKSTLLNIIAGDIHPDKGDIIINGSNVTKLPRFKRSNNIIKVFQSPFLGTCGELSLEENLSIALKMSNRYRLKPFLSKNDRKIFFTELKRFDLGLEKFLLAPIKVLSGGQRQCVTLLMASLIRPKVLLLDEHTSALDPKTGDIVMRWTDQIIKENKMTAIMISHNLDHVVEYGNRIIMLNRGVITKDTVKGDDQVINKQKILSWFD